MLQVVCIKVPVWYHTWRAHVYARIQTIYMRDQNGPKLISKHIFAIIFPILQQEITNTGRVSVK